MRLSQHSDYAIRVLIYLGINGEELCTIREIAERYGISNHHLVKVVHSLSKAGYVHTVRGKGGGIRLGRDPEEISIGPLVRTMEFDFQIVECFNLRTCGCCIAPVCRLRSIFRDALEAFLGTLDGYTLADLLQPRGDLRRLLTPRPLNGA